jgi:hypothetical protein
LTGASAAANLGGIADPDLVTQVVQHSLEPFAVAARLNTDAYFTCELRVEGAHLVERVVKKSLFFNLTIACIAPLDELLPGV